MLMARRERRPCMEDSGPELHVCRRRSVVLPRDSGGIARHLVVSTLMGVGFVGFVRYQPQTTRR